jgi:hypothetical protein
MSKWIEIAALVASLVVAFLIVNLIHFQFFQVYVVLYSCLLDALLASAIVLPAWWFLRGKTGALAVTEFTLAALVGNLAIIIYAIMGPTVVDRSLSIYIVEKLADRGGQISEAALHDVFVKEYMPEYRLLDVRLTEQVSSGTAVIKDGCIILTPRGAFLASAMSAYRKIFLPRKRVLMGEVTDELTDPFRNRTPQVDVTCRKK